MLSSFIINYTAPFEQYCKQCYTAPFEQYCKQCYTAPSNNIVNNVILHLSNNIANNVILHLSNNIVNNVVLLTVNRENIDFIDFSPKCFCLFLAWWFKFDTIWFTMDWKLVDRFFDQRIFYIHLCISNPCLSETSSQSCLHP